MLEQEILRKSPELLKQKGQLDLTVLQKGLAVLGVFEGQLFRAVVVHIFQEEKLELWFVDYGNSLRFWPWMTWLISQRNFSSCPGWPALAA